MKTISFQVDIGCDRKLAQKQILCLIEALVNLHRFYLRTHPKAPLLYSAGVKYIGQEGREDWFDYGEMLKQGGGDCKILAAARVAELRERKGLGWRQVRPFLKWKRNKEGTFYLYHVLVMHVGLDGVVELEDPSLKLGMREYHEQHRDDVV